MSKIICDCDIKSLSHFCFVSSTSSYLSDKFIDVTKLTLKDNLAMSSPNNKNQTNRLAIVTI